MKKLSIANARSVGQAGILTLVEVCRPSAAEDTISAVAQIGPFSWVISPLPSSLYLCLSVPCPEMKGVRESERERERERETAECPEKPVVACEARCKLFRSISFLNERGRRMKENEGIFWQSVGNSVPSSYSFK